MATRATRYRSHSPTPSPTHTFEHSQPYHSPLTVGVMTLNSRAPSQEHLYNGRNDLTLPPFSKNLVVGTGAPNSSRNTSNHYNQPYPLSPPRDLRNYARNKRPMPIPENDNSRDMPYSFDDNYSEFAQTKPPSQPNDSDLPHSRTLPPLGSPQFNNGSRSLPPLNQSAYQPAYGSGLESHRSRQLSINSIISSPGINSPNSNYSAFGAPSHGNGTMKKRKKSFGAEGQGEIDNIDSDRDRDVIRPNGDSGLGLEDPDVRMAAEALGDLRADLNHSGIACRPNHLRLSTASMQQNL
ncbi:hypothetical protein BDZ91DRAFT_53371 [Kalaharituber pfeilii]|nr:hypothetical protein BDZ91DRAFT_53371 [Kalaharituber pfeilii]